MYGFGIEGKQGSWLWSQADAEPRLWFLCVPPFNLVEISRQRALAIGGGVCVTLGLTEAPGCAFSPSLYNNQITDIGARYVAQILDECRGLTHLK